MTKFYNRTPIIWAMERPRTWDRQDTAVLVDSDTRFIRDDVWGAFTGCSIVSHGFGTSYVPFLRGWK